MAKTFVITIPGFPADENDSTCLSLIQSCILTIKKYPLNITFQIRSLKKNIIEMELK